MGYGLVYGLLDLRSDKLLLRWDLLLRIRRWWSWRVSDGGDAGLIGLKRLERVVTAEVLCTDARLSGNEFVVLAAQVQTLLVIVK